MLYVPAVTPEFAKVNVIAVVPDPDTSPVTVIVWLPVIYVFESKVHVLVDVFFNNPLVAEMPAMAVKSASIGCLLSKAVCKPVISDIA